MKSYIYKPNCDNCLYTGSNYRFKCQLCGCSYSAYVKMLENNKEKMIYCRFPGIPYITEEKWTQAIWLDNFKDNLVLARG